MIPLRTRRELSDLFWLVRCAIVTRKIFGRIDPEIMQDLAKFDPDEIGVMERFVRTGGVLYSTSPRSDLWRCKAATPEDGPGPWYDTAYRTFEDARAEGDVPCEGLPFYSP